MSRSYTKKSPYWENRKNGNLVGSTQQGSIGSILSNNIPTINYESFGENLMASCASTGNANYTRGKMSNNPLSPNGFGTSPYENLMNYPLPYEMANGLYGVNSTIPMVMRAYTAFPAFRNAIEVLVEFSTTPWHLKGGNAKSRAFTSAFLNKLGVDKLIPQIYREYYRSGNVFLYRFDGAFRDEDYARMREMMGARTNKVPIRYIILNPASIFVQNAIITNRYNYVKMLSPFEVQRLKNPQTDEERQMFNSLPEIVKSQIKNSTGGMNNAIYIPIDPNRLNYFFYKKQDYEPLATPMGFGVLNDIEWKLQLKRMDMALTKTIEHAMLLVTTGTEPEKGGVNPSNLQSLQNVFKNSTIGRVLVADWTTKAEWIIPDFKELLGPSKYEVVDKDIREGLQSILLGEDKFANAIIKARVFNERLKEGRQTLIREFLQPEINRVCESMNFKAVPTIYFEDISLEDETNLQRLYTRWAELGILSPWELMQVQKTGILPDKEENLDSQKEYNKLRDDGYYYPLVGASSPKDEGATGAGGRPSGSKSPKTKNKVSPIGGGISAKKLVEYNALASQLRHEVEKSFLIKLNIDKLDEAYQSLVESLCKSIMVNEQGDKWLSCVAEYMVTPKEQDKAVSEEIDEIRIMSDIDEWNAILVHKARIENSDKTLLNNV